MFRFQARDYQAWARNAFFEFWEQPDPGHPVIAMPTGTGKSIVIAELVAMIIAQWFDQRILILQPTKELTIQNTEKLASMAPTIPFGVCSASAGRYDTAQRVIFGTIGTVTNRRADLGKFDMVFVDEAHGVSDNEETQYRDYFNYLMEANPNVKFVALTATPYRVGLGLITDGGLFTDFCFDATGLDAFNWFIEQGYLVPLIPRPTKTRLDTTGVKKQGGDFQAKALQNAVNKADITSAAITEALELACDRQKILVFSTGIEHAEAIAAELGALGESVVCVHSKSKTRDEDLEAFQTMGDNGARWCVNYGVLTTGFDFPELDCIVMLRPTNSPGLWVQMLGRGTRPVFIAFGYDLTTQEGRLASIAASGKHDCLVLDFAYNTANMGPINDPKITKKKGAGGGEAPYKFCKKDNSVAGSGDEEKTSDGHGCSIFNHPSARNCIFCGAEFIFDVKFGTEAGALALLAGGSGKPVEDPIVVEYPVSLMTFNRHSKPGKPDSIRVSYHCGLRRFGHFITPEHGGNPRRRSELWWMRHGGGMMPARTDECIAALDKLHHPAKIRVWENKKYPEILDFMFEENANAP